MDKRLYTVKEAAAYLAVSPVTLYHWVCHREVPFVKLRARALRFDKRDLDRLVDRTKTEAGKEAADDGLVQARESLLANFQP